MILQSLQKRLPNYEKFEERVIANIQSSYFPLIYQSLYNHLGYERFPDERFTTDLFKKLLVDNNFLGLVNDIYRTRLSAEGFKKISNRLLEISDFDDYQYVLQQFKGCDKARYKGNEIQKNAFSFGTKLMHLYNPKKTQF